MGWLEDILLEAESERDEIRCALESIGKVQATDQVQRSDLEQMVGLQRTELARQKLMIEALTRFLQESEVVDEEEFQQFVEKVDAEDGVVDGKLDLDESTRRRLRIVALRNKPPRRLKIPNPRKDPPRMPAPRRRTAPPPTLRKRPAED